MGYPNHRYVQLVAVLIMKLTLAPALVAATTLAARRWGELAGGVVGGFPAVVGPILIAIDAEHGDTFAAGAATGALAGLLSLTAFVLTYAWVARRAAWPFTLLVSWAIYALATLALDGLRISPELALPLVLGSFAAGYALMPRTRDAREARPAPRWDLALRVVATAAFVVALTAGAGALGPRLSGLLAAFPVLASVLSVFIHAQDGPDAVADFLRGMLRGLSGFAAFCFVVALALPEAGPVAAFALATLVALAVNGGLAARAIRPGCERPA
jgi:hypothetical protein